MNNTQKKEKYSKKRQLGNKGEDIACNHLMRKGFTILTRNYLKKWGEIDIIAIKDEIIHFIEVKSVTRDLTSVSRITSSFRPEENVHKNKIIRLKRTIQTYIAEQQLENRIWEFSVAVIYMDIQNKKAKMIHLRNLIIE